MPYVVYILAFCCFAVSTQAYFINGIVTPLSVHFGLTVAVVAQLGSAFAIAYALTAPFVASSIQKIKPKHIILSGLGLTAAANLFAGVVDNFSALFVLRVVSGLLATLVIPIAAVSATYLVAPVQIGKALALIMAGVAASFLFGLPMSSLAVSLGGWPMAFFAVTGLVLFAFFAVVFAVPAQLQFQPRKSGDLVSALRGQAGRLVTLNFFAYAAPFATFAFLGALVPSNNVSSFGVPAYQAIIGAGCFLGLIIGGKAADAGAGWPFVARSGLLAMLAQILVGLSMMAGWVGPAMMAAGFFMAATVLFALLPVIQRRLAISAGSNAPVVFALNGSLTFLGQAVGTAAAGFFVGIYGLAATAAVGTVLAAISFVIAATVGAKFIKSVVMPTVE